MEDLEEAEDKISSLNLDLERAILDKNESMQRVTVLEMKISEMENDTSSNVRLKERAEEEVFALRTKITKFECQIDTIQKQRSCLKEQLDSANANLLGHKEETMKLESKILEEKKINETLNATLLRKDTLIAELHAKIRTLEGEKDRVKHDYISFKVTCDGMKAEKEEYDRRLSIYQKKIHEYEQDIFNIRELKMGLEQDISTLRFKVASLESQIGNITKDKDHYKSEYESVQANIRKLKEEVLIAHNQVREKDKQIEGCSAELREKEVTIQQVRNSKVLMETELLAIKKEFGELNEKYEFVQGRNRVSFHH